MQIWLVISYQINRQYFFRSLGIEAHGEMSSKRLKRFESFPIKTKLRFWFPILALLFQANSADGKVIVPYTKSLLVNNNLQKIIYI